MCQKMILRLKTTQGTLAKRLPDLVVAIEDSCVESCFSVGTVVVAAAEGI